MDETIAMANGFCNSEPISLKKNVGIKANIVVREVMIIALNLLCPAVCIASIRGSPFFLSSLIISIFKIESLMITPQVTMIPIALIKFSVCPQISKVKRANITSMGISANTIKGCKKLSN